MERSKELANRLTEVLLNGHWIANTNYKAQLESVTWKQATQNIGTLNTIALLTFHINYYLAGLTSVLKGGDLKIKDQYSFNLTPIQSEAYWQKLKNEFLNNAELFIGEVAKLSDIQLDQTFANENYGTYLRNIEGVIEHCYYHLGQIVLIKKMLIEAAE